MTQSTRIILNTSVTYGRSIVSLAFGLFSARWVLQALGQSDFGLYGVVGGLISIVSFLDIVLRTSVARFYAYTIGMKKNLPVSDYEQRMLAWFNTAFSLHATLSAIILCVGVPICIVMVRYVLVIPEDRVAAALVVTAISIVSTAFSIVSVPYTAMFNAKQLIAEVTTLDFVRIVGMFVGSYLLLFVRVDRLIVYAALVSFFPITTTGILVLAARRKFSCCRICAKELYCGQKMIEVGKYAIWKLFGVLGWSIRQNGSVFLINIFFGPIANAAFSVASQFASQSAALSSSLMTALTPALTTVAGEGNVKRFKDFTIRSCKFPSLLLIMLSCPLMLEIDYVLRLWFRNPPELANGICVCMTLVMLVNMLTSGCCAALSAQERIKVWQIFEFIVLSLTVPIVLMFYAFGAPFVTVGLVLLCDAIVIAIVRLVFSKKILSIGVIEIVKGVIGPCCVVAAFDFLVCFLIKSMLPQGVLRLVSVVICSGFVVTAVSWIFALTHCERTMLWSFLQRRIRWWRQ